MGGMESLVSHSKKKLLIVSQGSQKKKSYVDPWCDQHNSNLG
jgi:hypothetical protein